MPSRARSRRTGSSYGGSAKTTPNGANDGCCFAMRPASRASQPSTLHSDTSTFSPARPVASRFRAITVRAKRLFSTKATRVAPRDRASMPAAPLPAYRSRKARSRSSGSRIANSACFTRSPRGRVASPGPTSRIPRADPAMTRPALVVGRTARFDGTRTSGGAGRLGLGDAGEPAGCDLSLQGPVARTELALLVEHRLGGGAGLHGQVAMVGALERGNAEAGQAALHEAQHVALAAQLPVTFRELEAVVQLRDRLQPSLGGLVHGIGDQHAVRGCLAATDTAAELVELRQPEPVGAFHDHHRGLGHV